LIKILQFFYTISKVNLFDIWKRINKKHATTIVLCPSFPSNWKDYLFGTGLLNDLALYKACLSENIEFGIHIGSKNLPHPETKKAYLNYSRGFKKEKNKDYSHNFRTYVKKLVESGIQVSPSLYEASFWENKQFMHKRFEECSIRCPKTIVVENNNIPDISEIKFPILFKPAHAAGSMGIVKLSNIQVFKEFIKQNTEEEFLLQELVDMRRDIRMIYIGNELVVHYWRINNSDNWKPTSTSTGSNVDFETLPSQWLDYIFKQFKSLNITTGAFDITWPNDDLSKQPYILEVSPAFMPNPAPSAAYKNKSYSDYKKTIKGDQAYFKKYIELVFKLKHKQVIHWNESI